VTFVCVDLVPTVVSTVHVGGSEVGSGFSVHSSLFTVFPAENSVEGSGGLGVGSGGLEVVTA